MEKNAGITIVNFEITYVNFVNYNCHFKAVKVKLFLLLQVFKL